MKLAVVQTPEGRLWNLQLTEVESSHLAAQLIQSVAFANEIPKSEIKQFSRFILDKEAMNDERFKLSQTHPILFAIQSEVFRLGDSTAPGDKSTLRKNLDKKKEDENT